MPRHGQPAKCSLPGVCLLRLSQALKPCLGHNVHPLPPWQMVTSSSVTWSLTCAQWSRTMTMTLIGSTSTRKMTLRCHPEDTFSQMPLATARGRKQSSARLCSQLRACSVQASGRSALFSRQADTCQNRGKLLLVRSVWKVSVCCKPIKDPSVSPVSSLLPHPSREGSS